MNLKEKLGLNNNEFVVVILISLLTVCGIIYTIAFMRAIPTFKVLSYLVGYALVLFYVFVGYKKPHGNTLRYIIFAFAVILLVCDTINFAASIGPEIPQLDFAHVDLPAEMSGLSLVITDIIAAINACLICYMSGRLHKIDENRVIVTIVAVLFTVRAVLGKDANMILNDLNDLVIWLGLVAAYFYRYKKHKEVGLKDN